MFVLIGLLGAFGLWDARQRRTDDARKERTAAIQSCLTGNERLHTIRDVMLAAVKPPDPHAFDYITDPVLREGIVHQSTEARRALTDEITKKLADRNCQAEFPAPPG